MPYPHRPERDPIAHELIPAFLDYQRVREFSPATIKRRRISLNRWVCHVTPERLLTATLVDVDAWLVTLDTAQTRYSYLADLRAFYRWAQRRGYVTNDPTHLADSPRLRKRLPTPVHPSDVRRLVAAAEPGSRTRLMVAIAAYAGLRVSEIGALDRADIDLEQRELYVRNGKGGADRRVPISDQLAAELVDVPGIADRTPGPLFGVQGERVSSLIVAHMRSLGVRGRAHDLRAAFATELGRVSNGNVLAVMRLMGHESPENTMRYLGSTGTYRELTGLMFGGADR